MSISIDAEVVGFGSGGAPRVAPRVGALLARALGVVLVAVSLLVGSNAHADEPTRADIARAFFEDMSVTVARWAHPTLEMDRRWVTLDDDGVHVVIRYRPSEQGERPIVTSVFIPVDSAGLFGRMSVDRDSGFVPPFLFMTLFKELATRIIAAQIADSDDPHTNARNQMLRAIQAKMRAEWDGMDAMDLCKWVLFYNWVESGNFQRFVER